MSDFVLGGINSIAFLLCAAFLAYVACIVVPLIRHRAGDLGNADDFEWHFLIPCLNEERVIEATVSRLYRTFPKAHIWCVDDSSTDATHLFVARMVGRSPRVHLVSRSWPEAQTGKGPALNAGWAAIASYLPADADWDRIIVGVVDADGDLEPNCLSVIVGPDYFGRPEVGAVQIKVRVANELATTVPYRTRLLIELQDLEFSCVIAGMQLLRRHVGSAAMGGNGQFTRASTLRKVTEVYGQPWATA